MARLDIDRLDLKKRKEEIEQESVQPETVQQVPIHSAQKISRQDGWGEEDNSDKEAENKLTRQVAIHSAPAKKYSKKVKKFGERGSRQVAVRSVGVDRERMSVKEDGDTIDIRKLSDSSRKSRRSRGSWSGLEATRSFQEILREKTSGKVGTVAETAPAEEREENFQPAEADNYERSLLSNGLKLISAPIMGTKTVTIMMMFGTGSKYESMSMNGLSHFLEHMFFKGTKDRPNTQKISGELDALGCEYNAFTAKEYTGYWIKIDSTKSGAAMAVLSDMLMNSKFSAAEIEKERGVIIEEINMYHENPMMYIEDVFESCLYGDTPAGREIAGPKSNIRALKRQDFLDYFSSQYGANSAILCLAGNIDEKTERQAEKYFGKMGRAAFKGKLKTPDAQGAPAVKLHYKDGNQAIISLGVRAFDTYHEDKMIAKVLSVILGGSMSSRMFTEVREKRGLAYSVHTTAEFYTDAGYLTTQAGIPVGKQNEAIKVILGEYKKIKQLTVSKQELRRAKDLIKGRTIIGFEESDNVTNWYAKQAVLKEEMMSPEEFFAKLEKVTAADIKRVAKNIFANDRLNLAIIGPFKDEEDFEKIVKL
jgi:predicted Zn-dependent peptidase